MRSAINSRTVSGWFLSILPGLLLISAFAPPARAFESQRGKRMTVEFLFSIESVGGRGEKLRTPKDLFYDPAADELYVADAGLAGILIYSSEGTFLQEVPVEGPEGVPVLVTTDADGRIYVGHNRSAKITVFDFRGQALESLELPGTVDIPGSAIRPFLLSRSPAGHAIALQSSGGLVDIDPEGENSVRIPLMIEDGPTMIQGMTSDPQGRYYFTDMRPSSIVVWDSHTNTARRFGSQGVIYGQMSRPQGVAVDGSGHVFVTSLIRNNVLCYTEDGEFVDEFGGIGRTYGRFYMPSKIVSDGKDRIYVLEEPLRRIQVFRVSFPEPAEPDQTGR